MDRALDPELIRAALGDHVGLPTPEELADQLADAEIALVRGSSRPTAELMRSAWYLHSIASASAAEDLYPLARRRQAYQVSAHIFDVALASEGLSRGDTLRYSFAAQVGYVRGGLNPNATAVYRRWLSAPAPLDLPTDFSVTAVELGAALLGGSTAALFGIIPRLRRRVSELSQAWSARLEETQFGAAVFALWGIDALLNYLVFGSRARLDEAAGRFASAVALEAAEPDIDSRWVAALLLRTSADLGAGSVWSVLPPDVPSDVRHAFTFGSPSVLTLWPPQADVLGGSDGPHPFAATTRRVVLSLPTSAGKTLVAQMLVADHVARGRGGACFVAPTRSLCREIRGSLAQRLRLIRRNVSVDWSDELFGSSRGDVQVMTPERLAYLLRASPLDLLARFSLFVIDEAHGVGDASRGWVLESSLAILHTLTRATGHRIVLMSAALGNRFELALWLDPDGQGKLFASEWRGPRRLHCVYATQPNWGTPTSLPGKAGLTSYPQHGVLALRPTANGAIHRLQIREPIGSLVLRPNRKRHKTSTAFYRMLAPLAQVLGVAGPVLLIEASRAAAIRLALVLSEVVPESSGVEWLSELAATRLGSRHPLSLVLKKGVAFHHAALPEDLLQGIEEALGAGTLRYVVATTTLTEGVNLPVRTVIIAAQGGYGDGGQYHEFITGPRLLNAIGRAGRAGRESEGWVVLARQAEITNKDFDRLSPDEDSLHARSTLATDRALLELAALEDLLRARVDAVFDLAGQASREFISFVWFVGSALEEVDGEVLVERVEEFVRSTLAWQQLSEEARQRLLTAARLGVDAFHSTDVDARRRWARSGVGLYSARRLQQIADEISEAVGDRSVSEPDTALEFLLERDWLDRILALPEYSATSFRPYRSSKTLLAINIRSVLRDWLAGKEVTDIATDHLAAVADETYRLEQLGDFLTLTFENYLPWALGIVTSWVNEKLLTQRDETDDEPEVDVDEDEDADDVGVCVDLPLLIRHGASSVDAAELLQGGLAGRTLAMAVATLYQATKSEDDDIRRWLCRMSILEWQRLFAPSPMELTNLLNFARRPGAAALAGLLAGEAVVFGLSAPQQGFTESEAELRAAASGTIEVWAGERHAGDIPVEHLTDVRTLQVSGVPVTLRLVQTDGSLSLRFTLDVLSSAAAGPA